MKRVILFVIFIPLISSLNLFAQEYQNKTVRILPTTRLSIDGEANVKNFTCVFNSQYFERKKDISYSSEEKTIYFENAVLELRNEGFNCGHRAIDKDFHLLLKTKEYPKITLQLLKAKIKEDNKGEVTVRIQIAGISNDYSFPIQFRPSPIDRFVGKLKLNIKDFNLEPPKKLMGLIVIKEEIEISFDLLARI